MQRIYFKKQWFKIPQIWWNEKISADMSHLVTSKQDKCKNKNTKTNYIPIYNKLLKTENDREKSWNQPKENNIEYTGKHQFERP